MKTKLRFLGFGILSFFLLWAGYQAQGQIDPSNQEPPELDCSAAIDPLWLEHAKQQESTEREFDSPIVRVAYLIPSNRTPQPKGVEALQMVVREGHKFFLKQMEYNGLQPKSFNYETEADGQTPLVHVVNIPETDSEIESGSVWSNKINAALNAGLSVWQRGEIWILVTESHIQLPNGDIIVGGALGSSGGSADDPGVATMSSDFLTPLGNNGITDDRPYHGMIIPEIGPYPLQQGVSFFPHDGSTVSSISSVAIGAFWHELMHAFGIRPHDFRNDSNFNGNLMGNGFRGVRGTLYPERYTDNYTRLAYATAQALNYNHYFNQGLIRNQLDSYMLIPEGMTVGGGFMTYYLSASDQDGLALLRIVGHPDYHSVEYVLSGTEFGDYISTPYFESEVPIEFRFILYDRQGNKKTFTDDVVIPEANRAPWPYIRITPPVGNAPGPFQLNASLTWDDDGNTPITFEWDLDFDGIFDTDPSTNPISNQMILEGNHLIRVRVTDTEGDSFVSTPVALPVRGDISTTFETSFTLIDADTDLPITRYDPIPDGSELDLFNLPPHLSMRANVPPSTTRVNFHYDGQNNYRIENVAPYALFGDINGDYIPGEFSLGPHTVSFNAFEGLNPSQEAPFGKLDFAVKETEGSFILVDAATDSDILKIEENMIIDAATIEGKNLNIRTNHSAELEGYYVRLQLRGALATAKLEYKLPYSLFGDDAGDFNGESLPPGDYNLRAFIARTDSDFDLANPDIEVNFKIQSNAVTGFFYRIDEPVSPSGPFPIESGQTYYQNLGEFAGNVAVNATTAFTAGSVEMRITGPIERHQIENVEPYSLFGDNNGEFFLWNFPLGQYTLTATPYSLPNAEGEAGASLTVSFSIVEGFPVTLIRAVDVASGFEIANMDAEGSSTVIDQSITPTDNFSLLVNYECDEFDTCPPSVRLSLEGPISTSRIENVQPYTLFGDLNGILEGRSFPIGYYTLRITPYSGANATGRAFESVVRNFEIVNSGATTFLKSVLYPNPTREWVHIDSGDEDIHAVSVIDMNGREVMQVPKVNASKTLDVSRLEKGIYIVRMYMEKGTQTKKIIIQ